MRGVANILLLLPAFCLIGLVARAQANPASSQSLGQIAKKYREERTKETKKTVKVFTNDSLGSQLNSAAPKTAVTASGAKEVKPPTGLEPASSTKPSDSTVHDEKYYRDAMKELRGKQELHQRELEVLKQKLSQNEMQYYPDPNKALTQEVTRGDINKLRKDIDNKNAQLDADQQAIDDLRDQLRRDGGDAGWLQ